MTGLAIGASTVLAPVYVTEIAPPNWRGAMVGMFQFNITLGILVAYLSNYLIGSLQLGLDEWRWKFAIAFLPGLILFGLLFVIPQSPRWLAQRGRRDEARAILRQIAPEIGQDEENAILSEYAPVRKEQGLSWARHRKPILLAIAIAAFNQLAGINAILYYHQRYFRCRRIQQSLRVATIDRDRRHQSSVHHSRPVPDRPDRAQKPAPDWLCRPFHYPVGNGRHPGHQSASESAALDADRICRRLSPFRRAPSSGSISARYFPSEVRARGQSIGIFDPLVAECHHCRRCYPVVVENYSKAAPFAFFAAMVVLAIRGRPVLLSRDQARPAGKHLLHRRHPLGLVRVRSR